ncbi:NAD(P)-binding protein [Gonapodya prolifera JEL478]|uniref:NAD(P)-binding protein n=1 Tax=Gonapodya prolifera (strain JEL478) TaxID=1344416 RepID=A0A139AUH4_GONPJ|nr:NAD(P)-binding protein [Gonapodya prolifera JEL478]|eukprot:KXS20223.1 NAD(P)-binding protein [Gonapodya prolifera JEL478]
MKFAVIGATRGVGLEFVLSSLSSSHDVNLLARNPANLPEAVTKNPRASVIKGDVMDAETVENVVKGTDAVFVALGAHRSPDYDRQICSKGTSVVLEAMKKLGVSKIVCVSSLGASESWDTIPYLMRPIMSFFLSTSLLDKSLQESLIRSSSLPYVILRPPFLTDSPAKGKYKVGFGIGGWGVSRKDLAGFGMKLLEDETVWGQWVGKAPTVAD